jgi:hypothetical protein
VLRSCMPRNRFHRTAWSDPFGGFAEALTPVTKSLIARAALHSSLLRAAAIVSTLCALLKRCGRTTILGTKERCETLTGEVMCLTEVTGLPQARFRPRRPSL